MPLPASTPSLAMLDLFVSVVELGSISQAARAHGMSQPAASAAMARLERRAGVALLRRTTSGTEVTAEGERVAQWAREVIDAATHLNAALTDLRDDVRQPLTIAASFTTAEYLLPGWLAALRRVAPEVAVHVAVENSSHVAAEVVGGRAHIGFVEGVSVDPRLTGTAVYRDELVVVVHPDHPWARRRRPLTMAELAATRLVVREAGSGTREVLDRLLKPFARAANAQPLTELGSTTAVKQAVLGGAGPAVLSRLAVQGEVDAGRLRLVALRDADLGRELRAVWPRGQRLSRQAALLLRAATDGALASGAG